MPRKTGSYRITRFEGEQVRAFVPSPLPPKAPKLLLDANLETLHEKAQASLGQLKIAGKMVRSADWFLYGFVRKEAVITSQIEGTQATLRDVLSFEASADAEMSADVAEVCRYVEALQYARRELARRNGLPISTRLLCGAHQKLFRGPGSPGKQPGKIRTSQNWIGGSRPGNAQYVPPPAAEVATAMGQLEKWIHAEDPLPPLVRAGLAHVQFESIHPFLDGNGRIGRMLITLLLEHWQLLESPLLYLSLALKRRQDEYYDHLAAVRTKGDWEGWTGFYLECVQEAAADGVDMAQRIFALVEKDRRKVAEHPSATLSSVRLFDRLQSSPFITLQGAIDALDTSKPTAGSAIAALEDAGVLKETSGRKRGRIYAYQGYLRLLSRD